MTNAELADLMLRATAAQTDVTSANAFLAALLVAAFVLCGESRSRYIIYFVIAAFVLLHNYGIMGDGDRLIEDLIGTEVTDAD